MYYRIIHSDCWHLFISSSTTKPLNIEGHICYDCNVTMSVYITPSRRQLRITRQRECNVSMRRNPHKLPITCWFCVWNQLRSRLKGREPAIVNIPFPERIVIIGKCQSYRRTPIGGHRSSAKRLIKYTIHALMTCIFSPVLVKNGIAQTVEYPFPSILIDFTPNMRMRSDDNARATIDERMCQLSLRLWWLYAIFLPPMHEKYFYIAVTGIHNGNILKSVIEVIHMPIYSLTGVSIYIAIIGIAAHAKERIMLFDFLYFRTASLPQSDWENISIPERISRGFKSRDATIGDVIICQRDHKCFLASKPWENLDICRIWTKDKAAFRSIIVWQCKWRFKISKNNSIIVQVSKGIISIRNRWYAMFFGSVSDGSRQHNIARKCDHRRILGRRESWRYAMNSEKYSYEKR